MIFLELLFMNDHFGSSVSALEIIKISEIKRIQAKPVEIFIELRKTTQRKQETIARVPHTGRWK